MIQSFIRLCGVLTSIQSVQGAKVKSSCKHVSNFDEPISSNREMQHTVLTLTLMSKEQDSAAERLQSKCTPVISTW